jgi:hypothetical protein
MTFLKNFRIKKIRARVSRSLNPSSFPVHEDPNSKKKAEKREGADCPR